MYSYAPLGSPSSEKASRPCSLVLVQKPKPCSLPLAAQQTELAACSLGKDPMLKASPHCPLQKGRALAASCRACLA